MLDATDFNRIMNSVRALLSSPGLQYNGAIIQIAKGGTGAATASQALTNLGATTVGKAFFTLPNPSAIRFVRINADNSVSSLNATDFKTALGISGGGTVNAGTQYQATFYATTGSSVSGTADVIFNTSGGSGLTKVGINVAVPSVALDVVGTININDGSNGGFISIAGSPLMQYTDATGIFNFATGLFNVLASGQINLFSYGSGTNAGTPTYSLQVDASGNVIEGGVPLSTTLASANILVGNAGNVATAVAVSGDITISNAGIVTIGNLKVTSAMLAGSIDATKISSGIVSNTEFDYLDGAASNIQNQINNINAGLSWKNAARAATTANITLSGAQTIDGVSVIAGDRVLVKNQSTASQNGIYLCASSSWTRTTDADTGAEMLQATISVEEGTANSDTIYTCTTDAPITIGSTSLTFAKTSATTYTGSDGVTLTSNNFVLNNAYFSGDATISAGVIAIGALKVTNAMLAGSIAYSKLNLTGAILNADLAGSIAYSKLSLTGAILNADLAGSIAYSKLSLTGAILNADLAGSIAYSKLSLTGAVVAGDLASTTGSGAVMLSTSPTISTSIKTSGSNPTIAAGTGAGTSPSAVTVTGNDIAGIVSLTTGSSPTVGGDIVTVTFSATLSAIPKAVIVTAGNSTTSSQVARFYVEQATLSTTIFKIKDSTAALSGATAYVFYYFVIL